MLKRKFRWEKAQVLYKYLIEENSLIKDNQSAEEILNTLFDCPVSFLKEVNRNDGTKVCLFYVADEEIIYSMKQCYLKFILANQAMIGTIITIKTLKQYKKQLKFLNKIFYKSVDKVKSLSYNIIIKK